MQEKRQRRQEEIIFTANQKQVYGKETEKPHWKRWV